ncbi:MAG TPA: hypothetical protein DCR35_18595 [Runella sp.]|nr:hypothetical protein [Runella sp.]HAO51132.1 hypothetical protein [Runella sp.]
MRFKLIQREKHLFLLLFPLTASKFKGIFKKMPFYLLFYNSFLAKKYFHQKTKKDAFPRPHSLYMMSYW